MGAKRQVLLGAIYIWRTRSCNIDIRVLAASRSGKMWYVKVIETTTLTDGWELGRCRHSSLTKGWSLKE